MCRELGPLRLPSASPNRGPSYHMTRQSRAQAQAERIVTLMQTEIVDSLFRYLYN